MPLIRQPRSPFLAAQCSLTCRTGGSRALQNFASHHDPQAVSKNLSLRLMPLGGSVTFGVGSSDGNGYRKFLQDMLHANDFQSRFVGSRKSGSMNNNENEGWRGYRLDQIENKARRFITTVKPNIFTINAGSNDCIQNYQLDGFGERMGNMLEYLWETCPTSTVILSTLLVNANEAVDLRVLHVNCQLRRLAAQKTAEHRRIVLADMNGAEGPQLSDLVDGTHPDDDGCKKMAKLWLRAIQEASRNKYIHE